MTAAPIRISVVLKPFAKISAEGNVDPDEIDLHQAFFDVQLELPRAGLLTVRGGRQEIDYEDARLITVREGANVRLSFDLAEGSEGLGRSGRKTAPLLSDFACGLGVEVFALGHGRFLRLVSTWAFTDLHALAKRNTRASLPGTPPPQHRLWSLVPNMTTASVRARMEAPARGLAPHPFREAD